MSNQTLYAQWAAPLATYTVTFDAQGGSAVQPITGVLPGGKILAPVAPVRTGFVFAGWFKDTATLDAWSFANDTVNSNVMLFGKWAAAGGGGSTKAQPIPALGESALFLLGLLLLASAFLRQRRQ